MKIIQLLSKGKPTLSFEMFPPKPGMSIDPTQQALKEIVSLNPDFMSVTYGAGGSNSKNTITLASAVQSFGVTALAHMTCVSASKQSVKEQIEQLKANKIENILALRGDIPEEYKFPLNDGYRYACELIEDIKKNGDFSVGGACYPEGHVECASTELDIDNLKRKVDCGCDFLTTQMFFDNTVLYSFLYRTMAKNINVPVIAGIMPVTSSKQIQRSCALSGATLPIRFRRILDKFGDDPLAMKQAGIAYATEQIIDLLANGVRGIHVYTMNKPDVAKSICDNLCYIIKR